MKKLVAFMLCCMMMVGALSAFATETEIETCSACTHKGGTYTESTTVDRVCFSKTVHVITYCADCDEELGDQYKTVSTSSHVGGKETVTDIIDGEPVEVTYCTACGEEW